MLTENADLIRETTHKFFQYTRIFSVSRDSPWATCNYALLKPHWKWLCYFVLCSHGKLDLRFILGRDEKCIGNGAHIGRNREENNITMSFGERCLFICRHIYLCKQLLPQINSCGHEVLQINEMASPWSNHCQMPVASIKTTTR